MWNRFFLSLNIITKVLTTYLLLRFKPEWLKKSIIVGFIVGMCCLVIMLIGMLFGIWFHKARIDKKEQKGTVYPCFKLWDKVLKIFHIGSKYD